MKTVNILACANGVGISRDVEIIRRVLVGGGYHVEHNHTFRYDSSKKDFDLNIHLERFNPAHFPSATYNVMIPNQEWFDKSWHPFLTAFDCFFTKTSFADKIFSSLGCKTKFIGFTSEDRYLPQIKKDRNHWLHVAGKSIQKQTEIVINTWAKNPGFPQLTIVQDPKFWKPRTSLRNVNFMIDRVPEDVLLALQNASAVHVCPSETEGFGHYIMEAMSAKALVITTDAPPMTELVSPDSGLHVRVVRTEPMNLSVKNIIDEHTLAETVVKALVMDDGKRDEMGSAARAFFLHNHYGFEAKLLDAVKSLFS